MCYTLQSMTCVLLHVAIRRYIFVLSYVAIYTYICDRVLENSSKSHMKSSVFLHVFNDISIYADVIPKYFLNTFSNLSIEFHVRSIMKYVILFTRQ